MGLLKAEESVSLTHFLVYSAKTLSPCRVATVWVLGTRSTANGVLALVELRFEWEKWMSTGIRTPSDTRDFSKENRTGSGSECQEVRGVVRERRSEQVTSELMLGR